jgi:cyanophycinase
MTTQGPVALVGSGEYLPVMEEVERALIAGRPPKFVQLATAAAPEGPKSLARWHALGKASADRLGVQQIVVPIVDRISADDPTLAALVEGAGLVYLSGGNPPFLAATLRGTAVWQAIYDAWQQGSALAGCSAGAMALGSTVPDIRHPLRSGVDGLDVVPQLSVIPHFDRLAARMPDFVLNAVTQAGPGVTVVGIDEDTALVGGPDDWEVQGRQKAWVLTSDGRKGYAAGERLHLTP